MDHDDAASYRDLILAIAPPVADWSIKVDKHKSPLPIGRGPRFGRVTVTHKPTGTSASKEVGIATTKRQLQAACDRAVETVLRDIAARVGGGSKRRK